MSEASSDANELDRVCSLLSSFRSDVHAVVDDLMQERNFFFNKLREIELLCKQEEEREKEVEKEQEKRETEKEKHNSDVNNNIANDSNDDVSDNTTRRFRTQITNILFATHHHHETTTFTTQLHTQSTLNTHASKEQVQQQKQGLEERKENTQKQEEEEQGGESDEKKAGDDKERMNIMHGAEQEQEQEQAQAQEQAQGHEEQEKVTKQKRQIQDQWQGQGQGQWQGHQANRTLLFIYISGVALLFTALLSASVEIEYLHRTSYIDYLINSTKSIDVSNNNFNNDILNYLSSSSSSPSSLIHAVGVVQSRVVDELFDDAVVIDDALMLDRQTEYCQWSQQHVEECHVSTNNSRHCLRFFSYRVGWHPHLISSSSFDNPVGHYNPQRDPVPSKTSFAKDAHFEAAFPFSHPSSSADTQSSSSSSSSSLSTLSSSSSSSSSSCSLSLSSSLSISSSILERSRSRLRDSDFRRVVWSSYVPDKHLYSPHSHSHSHAQQQHQQAHAQTQLYWHSRAPNSNSRSSSKSVLSTRRLIVADKHANPVLNFSYVGRGYFLDSYSDDVDGDNDHDDNVNYDNDEHDDDVCTPGSIRVSFRVFDPSIVSVIGTLRRQTNNSEIFFDKHELRAETEEHFAKIQTGHNHNHDHHHHYVDENNKFNGALQSQTIMSIEIAGFDKDNERAKNANMDSNTNMVTRRSIGFLYPGVVSASSMLRVEFVDSCLGVILIRCALFLACFLFCSCCSSMSLASYSSLSRFRFLFRAPTATFLTFIIIYSLIRATTTLFVNS